MSNFLMGHELQATPVISCKCFRGFVHSDLFLKNNVGKNNSTFASQITVKNAADSDVYFMKLEQLFIIKRSVGDFKPFLDSGLDE